MFKLRSFVSLFLMTVILPFGGNGPISPAHLFYNNKHFVNVSIDKIQFLGNTGDVSGNGEFRLLVLSADTKGKSSGTFCPGTGPIVVKTGDSVNSPCLNTITFDEETVAEGVFLTIMALDEDKSSLPKDLSYEVVSNQLGTAFGKLVKDKSIKVAALSVPYAVPLQILISLLTGKVKSWVEQADIVGAQGLYLSRSDNWSATGKAKTVTSSDGGIKITYTVTRSSVPSSTSTPKSPAPTTRPTKTPQSTVASQARISCEQDINEVNMRKSPGYLDKDDLKDRVVKISCGEYVTLLNDTPQYKDGLNWWYVSWNGYNGWMADHTGSGRTILIFNP